METTKSIRAAKTMVQLENQGFRLFERNWRRRNVWESTAAAKAAKNQRDILIGRAWLNAAAFHLTNKAKKICEYLSVKAFHDDYTVGLDYNSPGCGCYVQIASPFDIEELLDNPAEIWKKLGI